MFLESLFHYLKGFRRIRVEGYFLERFLNLCMNRGIEVWSLERQNEIQMLINISKKDAQKINDIADATKCRVFILYEKGLMHLFKKYQKRQAIILGLIICVVGIYHVTSRIWHIEIVGDFKIPIEELYKELEVENVKKGVLKKNINFTEIKNHIYLRRNDIAWMGFDIKGTKATVRFVERTVANNIDNEALPCDIVADKQGIIDRVIAKEGVKVVNVGDYVSIGDVLISGKMVGKDFSNRLVHSDGEIWIKTWYQAKVSVPYEKDVPIRTGNENAYYQLKIGNYKINLRNSGTNFEKYDTITNEEDLVLFGKFNIPIHLVQKKEYELEVDTINYTKEQAIDIAKSEAFEQVRSQLPIDFHSISDDMYQIEANEQYVTVELTVQCVEKTGKKQAIS